MPSTYLFIHWNLYFPQIVAHELAHLFGLGHDNEWENCVSQGAMMYEMNIESTKWSTCSAFHMCMAFHGGIESPQSSSTMRPCGPF